MMAARTYDPLSGMKSRSYVPRAAYLEPAHFEIKSPPHNTKRRNRSFVIEEVYEKRFTKETADAGASLASLTGVKERRR